MNVFLIQHKWFITEKIRLICKTWDDCMLFIYCAKAGAINKSVRKENQIAHYRRECTTT